MKPDEPKINPKLVRIPRPRIYVTPEIAERACRKNSRHCMIAEAIYLALPGVARVSVDLQTIRWSDPRVGLRYTYLTPVTAQRALIRFDMGDAVKAFRFQLRGGHAASMVAGGLKGKRRQIHKLGKQQILTADEERKSAGIITTNKQTTAAGNWTGVVESIGGKPPPRLSPKHASHHSVRIFGLRAFTAEGFGQEPGRHR